MKLEFSRQILEKYANVKFHKNPSTRRIFMKYDSEQGMLNTTLITVTATNFMKIPQLDGFS